MAPMQALQMPATATAKPSLPRTRRAFASRPATSRRMICRPAASVSDLLAAAHPVIAALDLDWSDPDTQIGALGAFLGLSVGIGTPIFYISRDRRDEERLEELRALNRATKAETGEYLSSEEIQAIRPNRWTDRREFVDDD
jgi:hypothetical protein